MTPKEALLSVEDAIDWPPHTISDNLADLALEALVKEGYVIVTRHEAALVIEALAVTASRRESMARTMIGSPRARGHELTAEAMRALRHRIIAEGRAK